MMRYLTFEQETGWWREPSRTFGRAENLPSRFPADRSIPHMPTCEHQTRTDGTRPRRETRSEEPPRWDTTHARYRGDSLPLAMLRLPRAVADCPCAFSIPRRRTLQSPDEGF